MKPTLLLLSAFVIALLSLPCSSQRRLCGHGYDVVQSSFMYESRPPTYRCNIKPFLTLAGHQLSGRRLCGSGYGVVLPRRTKSIGIDVTIPRTYRCRDFSLMRDEEELVGAGDVYKICPICRGPWDDVDFRFRGGGRKKCTDCQIANWRQITRL